VTGRRRLLLDEGPGERRAVVLLDGQPERLWIERAGEPVLAAAGDRFRARVKRIERGLGLAFLDLGGDEEAVLALSGPAAGVSEGQALEVQITAPGRQGKSATVSWLATGAGAPERISPASSLMSRLQALAPDCLIERGDDAREAADIAEDAALATIYPLGAGASLAIERTRGLTAIDIDIGGGGAGDSRRAAAKVNGAAVIAAARLLRLKGLGGLVVFDLAGGGQDGTQIIETARSAFAPDMPGVAFGPVSRLGVFHLALPWRTRPLVEQLVGPDGLINARTVAQRMARSIEREAATAVRVRALCAPDVATAAQALAPALAERLGPRFDIQADPARGREAFEVKSL
jgi:Ribonuclease G/E